MPRYKYQFNPETLSYTKVERRKVDVVFLILKFLVAGIALMVIVYILYSLFFYTPKERMLARENEQMEEVLQSLKLQYGKVSDVLDEIEQKDVDIYRLIFEAEPVGMETDNEELAIAMLYSRLEEHGSVAMTEATDSALNAINLALPNQSRLFDTVVALAQKSALNPLHIPAIQPVSNPDLLRVAAPYGVRMHPFYKVPKMHYGVDFALPTGSPVIAAADGTIKQVNASKRGFGNVIIIDHGNGYETLYAHLEKMEVRRGAKVTRGQKIGTIGSTGMSMGPHLHYEVHFQGQPVDPLNYFYQELGPKALDELRKIASRSGQTLD